MKGNYQIIASSYCYVGLTTQEESVLKKENSLCKFFCPYGSSEGKCMKNVACTMKNF
jgi:hypothetical protein